MLFRPDAAEAGGYARIIGPGIAVAILKPSISCRKPPPANPSRTIACILREFSMRSAGLPGNSPLSASKHISASERLQKFAA